MENGEWRERGGDEPSVGQSIDSGIVLCHQHFILRHLDAVGLVVQISGRARYTGGR